MNNATRNGDTGKLFKILKRISGKSSAVSEVIKETNGDVITDQQRRVDRWAEHFRDLLNRPPPQNNRPQSHPDVPLNIAVGEPSAVEVKQAVKQIRSGSAAGEDGIPPELWKYGGPQLLRRLTVLLQRIWNDEVIPDDFYLSIILPLYKKGDKAVCSNHRGISLLDTCYKLLEIVILNRIRPEFDAVARENQCGFRPGRSTTDQILALRLLIDQRQEHRKPLVIAYVDFSAAFDSVDRSRMFDCLREAGVPLKVVNMIRLLYRDCKSRVRVYNTESEPFPVKTGVKQGAILSPLLFIIVLDAVLRRSMTPGLGVCAMGKRTVADLDYADDIALVSDDAQKLQRLVDQLSAYGAEVGLQISSKKTKICHSNCPPPVILLNGEQLEVVPDFPYLGSRITMNGDSTKDVTTRIAKASQAFNMLSRRLWSSTAVSLPTKLKVFYASIRPVLLYACDTWAVKEEDARRLHSFEMRCWRRMLNVSYLDHIPNNEIIDRIRPQMLIGEVIKRKRLTLLGHVLRMPDERLPKMFILAHHPWKRPRCGVRTTWLRRVFKDFKPMKLWNIYPGYNVEFKQSTSWLRVLQRLAGSRHDWRVMVDNVIDAGIVDDYG